MMHIKPIIIIIIITVTGYNNLFKFLFKHYQPGASDAMQMAHYKLTIIIILLFTNYYY